MKLSISENANPNYLAKIVTLNEPRKHSNADRLQCWSIDFQNVITDLSYQLGDVCIYFPIECTINKDLISYMNGFEDKALNQNPEERGFFNKHARVRAISLRGEKSQGFLVKLSFIMQWLNEDTNDAFNENEEFDTINGITLCQKYIPKLSKTQGSGNVKQRNKIQRISRLVPDQFRLHVDTSNLRKNVHNIYPNDTISLAYKKHGTSFVVGNVLTKKKLKLHHKILKALKIPIEDKVYDIVYSSRKVVKNEYETKQNQHFYGTDIWGIVKEELKDRILPGLTLYGEIIGFLPDGGYIQKQYDYGCKQGEHKTYIYRITFTNPEGNVFEFDCNQIKEYCNKYELLFEDTLIYHGKANEYMPQNENESISEWQSRLVTFLEGKHNEKDCYMCINKVPEEGIVLRKQSLFQYEAYKLKSARFLEYETKELDSGEENIEDLVEENLEN